MLNMTCCRPVCALEHVLAHTPKPPWHTRMQGCASPRACQYTYTTSVRCMHATSHTHMHLRIYVRSKPCPPTGVGHPKCGACAHARTLGGAAGRVQ